MPNCKQLWRKRIPTKWTKDEPRVRNILTHPSNVSLLNNRRDEKRDGARGRKKERKKRRKMRRKIGIESERERTWISNQVIFYDDCSILTGQSTTRVKMSTHAFWTCSNQTTKLTELTKTMSFFFCSTISRYRAVILHHFTLFANHMRETV